VDAENRFLWRFPPRRLEGEAVRDAMLCASGQINWERGGPGFRPFTVFVDNSHFYTLTDPVGPVGPLLSSDPLDPPNPLVDRIAGAGVALVALDGV